MTIQKRDMIASVVLGSGSLALFLYASGFPVREGQPLAVSPGFYPKMLAVLLGILSVLQIVNAIIGNYKLQNSRDSEGEKDLPPIWKDRHAFNLFSITLGALIAYPLLMQLIGFAFTGFIFLGTLIFALSKDSRKGRQLIFIGIITIGISVLTYLVFRVFLRIPFPTGLIRI